MEIQKIDLRRPRSVNDAKLSHFTLLFCRGRQRNVERFITHVHNYCFAHKPFVWWRSRYHRRRGLLKLPIVDYAWSFFCLVRRVWRETKKIQREENGRGNSWGWDACERRDYRLSYARSLNYVCVALTAQKYDRLMLAMSVTTRCQHSKFV